MAEIDPTLGIVLWNGLFVRKETPQDVRDKIIAAAKKAVMSDRVKEIAAATGGAFYWEDAEASAAHIKADIEAVAAVNKLLE